MSITQWCIHELILYMYEMKTIAYGASNSILLSYYYQIELSKSIRIYSNHHRDWEQKTITGIGNKSVSHDLYISKGSQYNLV